MFLPLVQMPLVFLISNPEDQYAKNRFISYIPFGPNFNANEYIKPQYDNFNNDLSLKLIQSDDYRISGLRVIDFDLETEFNKIFKDDYMIDSSNYSQVNYLKHWKLLQHYKNLYPRLNLELILNTSHIFLKIHHGLINGAYNK